MSKLSAQDSGINPNTLMHHQKLSNNNNMQMHHQQQSQHHHHHHNIYYHHHHRPKHHFSNNNYNYPQQHPQHYQVQSSKYNNNPNYSNHAKQTSSSHQSMVATNQIKDKQRIFPSSNNSSTITHGINYFHKNNYNNNNLDGSSQDNFGPVIENEEEIEDNEKKSTFFNSAWLFPEEYIINNTPSRIHGISYEAEMEYRRKGTNFIREFAKYLKLKPICKETAYVYFHRFFLLRSFKIYEPIRIAIACIYFACKYEDNPLCKDHVIQVTLMLNKRNAKFDKQSDKNLDKNLDKHSDRHSDKNSDKHSDKQSDNKNPIKKDDKEYIEYCDRLISDENSLIQAIGFCFVKHFQVLLLESYSQRPIPGTSKELYSAAYQIASEVNRLTTLCLEYNAPTLAAVSLHLAAFYKCVTLPDNWCLIMMPDLKNPNYTKELVLKISGQYHEILASNSNLIKRMLSKEYIIQYGIETNNKVSKNKSQMADIQKQLPQQSLLTNFSPDSAYSSSSSYAPTYSPAEKIINETAVMSSSGEIDYFKLNSNNNALVQGNKTITSSKNSKSSMILSPTIYNKYDASATSLLNSHEQQQSLIATDQNLLSFRNNNYNKNQAVNHSKQLSSQNKVECSSTMQIQNSVNKYKRVAAAADFYDNDEDQFQQTGDEFNNTLTPFSHINSQSQQQQEEVENYKKFKSNPPRDQQQQLNSRNDSIYYHHPQQAPAHHLQQLKKYQQLQPPNNSNSSSTLNRGN